MGRPNTGSGFTPRPGSWKEGYTENLNEYYGFNRPDTSNRFTEVPWKKKYKTVDESFEAVLKLLLEGKNVIEQQTIDEHYRNIQEGAGNPYINVKEKRDFVPANPWKGRASFKPAFDDFIFDLVPELGMIMDNPLGINIEFPGITDKYLSNRKSIGIPIKKWLGLPDRRDTPDTLTVFKDNLERGLGAEYTHAQAFEEMESMPPWKRSRELWKMSPQNIFLRLIPTLLGQGEPIYDIPGTFEHHAHSVRSPRNREEYNVLYQSNLDSYLKGKYGMTSSEIYLLPGMERDLDPQNFYDALQELKDLQNQNTIPSVQEQRDRWNWGLNQYENIKQYNLR